MTSKAIMTLVLSHLLLVTHSMAATRATVENQHLKVRIATNAPQPISAFYEGRGFQKNMINVLKEQCFVSVFILNKSSDFIWLDLSKWTFNNADGEITRLDRQYWRSRWKAMNIPMAHQSTFRWTLIPETLDFYPGEKEGGNIILPRNNKPFSITAQFDTGKNRDGKPLRIAIDNMTCATDK